MMLHGFVPKYITVPAGRLLFVSFHLLNKLEFKQIPSCETHSLILGIALKQPGLMANVTSGLKDAVQQKLDAEDDAPTRNVVP